MAKPFCVGNNWQYFSAAKGDIVELGPITEEEANRLASEDKPTTTIAQVLATDIPANKPDGIATNKQGPVSPSPENGKPALSIITGGRTEGEQPATAEKPKRKPLSATFLKKLTDKIGQLTANLTTDFERFVFKMFGYTTEELEEDDPDVEILKMGYEAIWNDIMEGETPPIWVIVAFGHMCITVRLANSAKKIKKEENNEKT